MNFNIGEHPIGAGHPAFIIAEIGINHSGSLDTAIQLIDAAKASGADAIKMQKRTPDICVPRSEWDKRKDTPWGEMSYIEYKRRMELGKPEYGCIADYCRNIGIVWFASCWDIPSVDFIEQFNPPCYKAASASLTDGALLVRMRDTGKPVILSTGMATWDEVGYGAHIFAGHPYALLHSRSVYPAPLDELNLRMIHALAREFPDVPIGYSGHETGLATTVAAVTLGACIVERHITLDRAAWGTDQASSLEPTGFARMVKDIRAVERAMGDGEQRYYISEQAARNKLRPPNAIWKKQGQSKAEKAASSMVNK